MRLVIRAAIGVMLLFGLYWGAAALALRLGAEALLTAVRAAGSGDAASIEVAGFPQRFSLHLTAPHWRQGYWAWRGDDLRLSAPSQAPLQMRLDLPPDQTLRFGWQELSLHSRDMQAVLSLVPGASLALAGAEIAADALQLRATGGATFAAESLRLNLTDTDTPARYRLQADLVGLQLPAAMAAERGIAPRADAFSAELGVQFSQPLDRYAGSTSPRLTAVQVMQASFAWGDAGLRVDGTLAITGLGQPEGRLMLQTGNWRAVFALAVALGMVQREVAPTYEALLVKLEDAGGGLTIPLEFRLGWAFLGPVPLGPAPYLQ